MVRTFPAKTRTAGAVLKACLLCLIPVVAVAQVFNPALFSALQWRLIGPFRGGRISAVTGVPGQPATFLVGTPGGGIWRTTDAGRVWHPISDNLPFPSIGALAVAPSDPKVIYVGTGEQIAGRGMFKSTDSGTTWVAIGLEKSRFIQSIIVDPHNPDKVVVGANDAGFSIIWPVKEPSPYSEGAGIFRTLDGGKSWTKAFTVPDTVGVADLCAEPGGTSTLYASFYKRAAGTGDGTIAATSFLFKSSDGGVTWKELKGQGLKVDDLPEKGLGRVGIAVAPGSNGRRLYLIANQGFFRSDDGGLAWHRSSTDPRVAASEYFGRVFVDPNDADKIFVPQTSMYRSTDGGHTFEPFAGAPSGDDFHLAWIDPANSNHIIFGVDQGAIVSLDGGGSWSSWDNQPTGQFYHVITDNQFPYRVYAAQQDSGTAAVLSRGDNGEITPSDWYSIAGFEYCHIAPDPLHPNLVYSGGWYGSVVRFDKNTGQVATVFDRGKRYVSAGLSPLFFLPHDPDTLLLGMQYVLKTSDGGLTWREISPDLTAAPGKETPGQDVAGKQSIAEKSSTAKEPKAAISALAASPVEAGLIWAGTSNRLMQLTRDGGYSWHNVSPAGLPDRSAIRMIEPSHFDAGTAFIVIGEKYRALAPLIFRTHDFGRNWQAIALTLPQTDESWVVREDPARKGLLYAGTALGVYVSFDEGDHWQTLQLNLPHAPVTDITIHNSDLIVSTFGRALWVLDDVAPLRQFDSTMSTAEADLLRPVDAIRTHWDTYQDTPLAAETPAGANPPDGAIIDYYLSSPPQELSLAVYDADGKLVRAFASVVPPADLPPANVPKYWFAAAQGLTRITGLNRFVWDLRYAPPAALSFGYTGKLLKYTEYTLADHAIPGATPRRQPQAALVLPGSYTLELTAGGKKYRQPLAVKLDPRVQASAGDLEAQAKLLSRMDQGMTASYATYQQAEALRAALKSVSDAATVKTITTSLDELESGTDAAPGVGPVNRDLARLQASLINADERPSEPVLAAVRDACQALDADLGKWRELNNKTLRELKLESLRVANLSENAGCAER
jgi:photosystem II stability/assembly factor-like uncharacterized protein